MLITIKRSTYRLGRIFGWLGSVPMVLFAAIVGVDTSSSEYSNWANWTKVIVSYTKDWSLQIWVMLVFLSVLGVGLRKLGRHWVWDTIESILNDFQKKAFVELQCERNDRHRVTLFRRKRCVWFRRDATGNYVWNRKRRRYPWSGWLVPVLRSGHKPLNSNAIFLAPHDGREAEGIVGFAWDSCSLVCKDNLPKLQNTSGYQQRARYAKNTFCTPDMVDSYLKNGKNLPRSVGGVPVIVNGSIWGVLVLDSQDKTGVTPDVLQNFSLTVGVIGKLLEKI